MYLPSRRELFRIGCRSLASAGAMSALARMGELNALAATSSNYKALVCVFLLGGNDCHNTVIPISTPSQSYATYSAVRQALALSQGSLLPVVAKSGATYGLHPKLTEIQALYQQGKAALLSNVGMLVQPVTRTQYLNRSVAVPSNLFSHSDQTDQWQTGFPNNLVTTGWGGRAADLLQAANGAGPFPTVATVSACGLFCAGQQTYGAVVPPNAPLGLSGPVSDPVVRLAAFQNLLSFDNGLSLVQSANVTNQRGLSDAAAVNNAIGGAPKLQTAFPATPLGVQLQQVAKLISVHSAMGMNRQIFFASLGGFDTHSAQLPTQDALLQQLSQALGAFYQATVELGVDQQVTSFTNSEFGRTLQPSSGGGSDHAWGGHQIILGGAVHGGDLYGQFPALALGGPDDANTRGALIPSTSVEQYGATLASWFGVADQSLGSLFPNLPNFASPKLAFMG